MGLGLLAGVAVIAGAGAAQAAEPNLGNSESAHACQHGGWTQLVRAEDGSSFANQGECVAHSALAHSAHDGVGAPPAAMPRLHYAYNEACTSDGGLLYDDVAGVPVLGCAFDMYVPAPHLEATAAMGDICQAIGGTFVVRNEGWVLHVVCTPPA
jgi:hypothetical protein